MTTPRDIIQLSLLDSGVIGKGQTASAEDTNNAFTRLNWMLAQWNRKRWLVYHLLDKSIVSTGAQFYTVGPGGDIDMIERPDKLEAAYVRQLTNTSPNQIDYPLTIISSMENYSQIPLKQLNSFPYSIFYDTDYPLAKVYPFPIPQASVYEVHILVKMVLAGFASLDEVIVLPPEYYAAIYYNFVLRLATAYKMQLGQAEVALAKDALNVVRGANTQISKLSMPRNLMYNGRYNPYSDQSR